MRELSGGWESSISDRANQIVPSDRAPSEPCRPWGRTGFVTRRAKEVAHSRGQIVDSGAKKAPRGPGALGPSSDCEDIILRQSRLQQPQTRSDCAEQNLHTCREYRAARISGIFGVVFSQFKCSSFFCQMLWSLFLPPSFPIFTSLRCPSHVERRRPKSSGYFSFRSARSRVSRPVPSIGRRLQRLPRRKNRNPPSLRVCCHAIAPSGEGPPDWLFRS